MTYVIQRGAAHFSGAGHRAPWQGGYGARIEICAGMASQGDELLLSFGVDDSSAQVLRAPRSELLALLD